MDDLLANLDKLTKTEHVMLFVTLSGHIFSKKKHVLDKFTLEQLKKMFNQSWMDKDSDPTN